MPPSGTSATIVPSVRTALAGVCRGLRTHTMSHGAVIGTAHRAGKSTYRSSQMPTTTRLADHSRSRLTQPRRRMPTPSQS